MKLATLLATSAELKVVSHCSRWGCRAATAEASDPSCDEVGDNAGHSGGAEDGNSLSPLELALQPPLQPATLAAMKVATLPAILTAIKVAALSACQPTRARLRQ